MRRKTDSERETMTDWNKAFSPRFSQQHQPELEVTDTTRLSRELIADVALSSQIKSAKIVIKVATVPANMIL